MADQETPQHRFEVRPTSDSHFGWIRTRLALERTMIAWVRTAVALIGFGFTLVQFFERLRSEGAAAALRPPAPRYLGAPLIAAGVIALHVSVWQYRSVVRYLLIKEFEPIAGFGEVVKHTPLYAVSIAIMSIGLSAFGAVFIRAI